MRRSALFSGHMSCSHAPGKGARLQRDGRSGLFQSGSCREVAIRQQGGTPELLPVTRLPETLNQAEPLLPHDSSPADRLMRLAPDVVRRNGGLGPGWSFTWSANRCRVSPGHRLLGSYATLR